MGAEEFRIKALEDDVGDDPGWKKDDFGYGIFSSPQKTEMTITWLNGNITKTAWPNGKFYEAEEDEGVPEVEAVPDPGEAAGPPPPPAIVWKPGDAPPTSPLGAIPPPDAGR